MTHFFKGDELEVQMYNAFKAAFENIESSLDEMAEGVYTSQPMGELLYDTERVPLTNAIDREVFITCFSEIFEAWALSGSFEAYLTVFRKIFGETVTVVFDVPGPGQLTIDVTAESTHEFEFIARVIESGSYVTHNVVDDLGNQIVFTGVLGLQEESDLEKILFVLVPAGIYTEISLTIV